GASQILGVSGKRQSPAAERGRANQTTDGHLPRSPEGHRQDQGRQEPADGPVLAIGTHRRCEAGRWLTSPASELPGGAHRPPGQAPRGKLAFGTDSLAAVAPCQRVSIWQPRIMKEKSPWLSGVMRRPINGRKWPYCKFRRGHVYAAGSAAASEP